MTTLADEVKALKLTVYGNGKKGLTTIVDGMVDDVTEIKWLVRTISTAIILWLVAQFFGVIKPVTASTILQPTTPRAAASIETPLPEVVEVKGTVQPAVATLQSLLGH